MLARVLSLSGASLSTVSFLIILSVAAIVLRGRKCKALLKCASCGSLERRKKADSKRHTKICKILSREKKQEER
jgi:uncharacterized C2H2 Zn-finger protein